MLRKKKFLIGGLILFLAIAFLGYRGFMEGASYYTEVTELLGQGSSIYGENVRVNGRVVPGSVKQETEGLILRFIITDIETEDSLSVVYQGVVPDTFKAGNEVVVEGYLDSDGVFQGHTLLPKCASKYAPE